MNSPKALILHASILTNFHETAPKTLDVYWNNWILIFSQMFLYHIKYLETSNSVFRENRSPHREFLVFPWKLGQGHQNLISSLLYPNYSWKFGKNPTTGSKYIVWTRQCNRIFSFYTAMTLKIRSRSPKSVQFFVMSQIYKLYIHANLVRIWPLVHKILHRQESIIEFSVSQPLWPWK